MADYALRFRAGPLARELIERDGFSLDQVRAMAGASGGAKWLVLSRLDRVLSRHLQERREPLTLIGSSIGAWRFACYGMQDPIGALDAFEDGYIRQRFESRPPPGEITEASREILNQLIGPVGAAQVVSHPAMRLNIVTVRARGPLALESPVAQLPALALCAAANAVSRRTLGAFFERAVFADPRQATVPFADDPLPTHYTPLSAQNVIPAVLASGAIPLVLAGVRDIPGAPPGTYRDGGITDYHYDTPFADDGLVLYPHFYGHMAPGWFDKRWPHRRAGAAMAARTLLMCPSDAFVAALPRARVPDRHDFTTLDNDTRIRDWLSIVAACDRLADELEDVLHNGLPVWRIEPL